MSQWKDVFPAVTTKMTPEGTIDAVAMQSSLDRPEWTRAPRPPLVGEERARVVRTVQVAMRSLEAT